MNIAILVSGAGSNMQAIIDACNNGVLKANIAVVISNNPRAGAINIAKKHNIETCIINHKSYLDRQLYDKVLLKNLHLYKIDLLCLAGFMRVLTADFLENCNYPVINIHPSLLPAFKGINAIEQAYNYGVKITGCTVHYVTKEVDAGRVIIQKPVAILPNDDLAMVTKNIHQAEHQAYIEAIKYIINKN
jgi:phosphoribosylglycinamide formyltransferase-1